MQQQDVSANAAGNSSSGVEERWHIRRKIIGISAVGLIFIVSALSVLYFLGNRASIFQTGGLLLLSVSFLIMRTAERIAGPEMDKLFRREKHAHRGVGRRKKSGACSMAWRRIMRCGTM